MPLDLASKHIRLICKDDYIIVDKDKLRIFNYFNKIFEDEPDIKEIEIDEEYSSVLHVIKYIHKIQFDELDTKFVSYYFFKWDAIIENMQTEFPDFIIKIDKLYPENKDAFEYFSKWMSHYMNQTKGIVWKDRINKFSPGSIDLLHAVSSFVVNGKYSYYREKSKKVHGYGYPSL